MSYIFVGLNVWLFSRQGVHIGASGLVYALFGFLLIGGFISRNKRLLALAFLNVFWYGSMIWGIFPTEPNISWESHLIGLLFGILLAYLYLPLKNIKSESHFGNENENGDEGIWQDPQNTDFYHNNSTYNIRFKYHFTEKKDTHEKDSL